MYEIIDNKGVLFSGSESEMSHIFDVLTNSNDYTKKEFNLYKCDWIGDLKLIQVLNIYK